jgi:hypothetical protein
MYSKTIVIGGISFEIVIQRCINNTEDLPEEITVREIYQYSAKIFKEGELVETGYIDETQSLTTLDELAIARCEEIALNEGFNNTQTSELSGLGYVLK